MGIVDERTGKKIIDGEPSMDKSIKQYDLITILLIYAFIVGTIVGKYANI